VYAQLASSMIHANPLHRAGAGILTRNRLGQSGLWAFGISGDLPILLMRIADVHRIELVKQSSPRPTPTGARRDYQSIWLSSMKIFPGIVRSCRNAS